MTPDILEIIGPLIGAVSIGAMILIGMKIRYTHQERTRLDPAADDLRVLTDTVSGLRDEVGALREEMTELNERVDFAERLLTRGRPESPPEALPRH